MRLISADSIIRPCIVLVHRQGFSGKPVVRYLTQVSHPCFILSVALQVTGEDDFYIKAIRYRQLA
ncbi:MAG: hypothetical protein MJE63_27125, partial [Proteobacteria bacterium]|nr:hypothetical protein [Pseudomonadota bacterium]